jgi:hypothetical protein
MNQKANEAKQPTVLGETDLVSVVRPLENAFRLRWKKAGKPDGITELIIGDLAGLESSSSPDKVHAVLTEAVESLEHWVDPVMCARWGTSPAAPLSDAETSALSGAKKLLKGITPSYQVA